jgi:hypothetical protein
MVVLPNEATIYNNLARGDGCGDRYTFLIASGD